jgi:hypothetical protein
METISIDTLTKKLKNAPQSVLERVMVYIDALVESEKKANLMSCLKNNNKY